MSWTYLIGVTWLVTLTAIFLLALLKGWLTLEDQKNRRLSHDEHALKLASSLMTKLNDKKPVVLLKGPHGSRLVLNLDHPIKSDFEFFYKQKKYVVSQN